jgi:hypothetical protein
MDCHRADQLGRGYTTWRTFDDYLENSKYEPQQVNIYRSTAKTYRRMLVYYARLRTRGFGWRAASPRALGRAASLFGLSLAMSALGMAHTRRHRMTPKNRRLAKMRDDFGAYRAPAALTPWTDAASTPGNPVRQPVYSSLAPYATAAVAAAAGDAMAGRGGGMEEG